MPKGLYLIKSGQCVVCRLKVSIRDHKLNEIHGMRRVLKDKHPLFNEFDIENSLFNSCKIGNKAS